MTKWSRYLMAAVLAVFIFFLFYSGVDENLSAQGVLTEMKEASGTDSMTERSRRDLLRCYGINNTDIDSFVLYGADNSLDATEFLLIKARNESQMQEIRKQVEAWQLSRMESFESYDAEQAENVRNGIIRTRGPFLLYVVGDSAEGAAEAFVKAVK